MSNSDFGGNYNNSPIKFGPPQAENFGDFGTPKMRFLKGKTLKTGPKKVTKIVLIKTLQIQDLSRNYNNSPVKFRNFGPIRSLRGGVIISNTPVVEQSGGVPGHFKVHGDAF